MSNGLDWRKICLENVNMQKYEQKLLAKISKTFPASKSDR
jgi:hypothetical protein